MMDTCAWATTQTYRESIYMAELCLSMIADVEGVPAASNALGGTEALRSGAKRRLCSEAAAV